MDEVAFELDPVSIFGDHAQGVQHVQGVVYPSLHILEVKIHFEFSALFQNLFGNLESVCLL